MDILSHHYYVAHTTPEATLALVDKIRAIASKHGLSRLPLWNTEAGWWIAHSDGTEMAEELVPGWIKLNATEAAAYVSRALILGWAAGLERYYWYDWDGYSMGLIEPTTKAIKPAGQAYERTLAWLLGSTMTGCGVTDDVWICTLVRPDGGRAKLVWQENNVVRNWRPPDEWGVKEVQTLDGARQKVSGSQEGLTLGQAPIYLS